MLKKRLDNIAIMRVFCILVVVFFHCYGMCYAESHFPETVSVYEQLYFIPNQCIFINVAMPLFVLISGYLFSYLLQLGKYSTWGNLFRKKGLRILVPYFVFGLFFMATTGAWHPFRLLDGGYWHLWFLPMLFWCFIVGYAIYRIRTNVVWELLLLVCAFIGTFMPKFIPCGLDCNYITRWFYWFYLGMLVYKYKGVLYLYIGKYKLYLYLFAFYAVITYLYPTKYGSTKWYSNLAVTGCLVSIVYLMDKVDWSKIKVTTPLVKFSSYSFGIYIWHNWVALMLISKTLQRLFGLPELAANHVVLFPLCFSLITLFISWGLSWGMMKTKVGKFLIR